jgi:hypothetical protein
MAARGRGLRWAAAAAIALELALAGCLFTTDGIDDERETWRSQGIADYQVQFRLICFCAREATEPVILQVRNRALVSVTRVADGAAIDPSQWTGRYYTVDELFVLIEDARERGAAQVRVSYDRALGYPTEVFLDQSAGVADDERTFELSGLVAR